MSQLVVLSPEQLEEFVQRAIERTLAAKAEPEIMEPEQCAALLGVTKRTVTTYVETEQLPAHQLGPNTLRFRRSEVLSWLTARKAKLNRLTGKDEG